MNAQDGFLLQTLKPKNSVSKVLDDIKNALPIQDVDNSVIPSTYKSGRFIWNSCNTNSNCKKARISPPLHDEKPSSNKCDIMNGDDDLKANGVRIFYDFSLIDDDNNEVINNNIYNTSDLAASPNESNTPTLHDGISPSNEIDITNGGSNFSSNCVRKFYDFSLIDDDNDEIINDNMCNTSSLATSPDEINTPTHDNISTNEIDIINDGSKLSSNCVRNVYDFSLIDDDNDEVINNNIYNDNDEIIDVNMCNTSSLAASPNESNTPTSHDDISTSNEIDIINDGSQLSSNCVRKFYDFSLIDDDNDEVINDNMYNTSSLSHSPNEINKNDDKNKVEDKAKNVQSKASSTMLVDKWYNKYVSSSSYDSSSSDSDDNDPILIKIREMNRKSSPYHKMNKPGRKEAINSIINEQKNNANAALQCLLWAEVGCSYDLFPHQFIAVRAAAGVIEDFPCMNGRDDNMIGFDKEAYLRRTETLQAFDLSQLFVSTPGLILADTMGLGKTVVGIAAIMLRNYLYELKGERHLPTLIVCPNDAVLDQWRVTLLNAGVIDSRVHVMDKSFSPNHMKKIDFKNFYYILFTRFKLQVEMRRVMESTTAQNQYASAKSVLFPHAKRPLIRKLRNCYLSNKGEEASNFRQKHETIEDCATRMISEATKTNATGCLKPSFRSVIIDEAHFHKNLLAYWGIAAALLGLHSQRMLLLTGTPYNNGPMDMASLMTFIDPSHESARRRWWEDATSANKTSSFTDSVKDWREKYMLRRGKDVLKGKIPSKTVSALVVSPYPTELAVYEAYEDTFLHALQCLNEYLTDDITPAARKKLNEAFEIMMATIQCMRMSLIHPILPGGREASIQFSPSRNHLAKRQENPFLCVCCAINFPSDAADKFKTKIKEENKMAEKAETDIDKIALLGTDRRVRSEINLDDEELNDEDYDKEKVEKNVKKFVKSATPLNMIDADLCSATDCRHYAHLQCIETLRATGLSCPKCSDLQRRVHYCKEEDKNRISHNIYCKNIKLPYSSTPGITASAKIEKVIEWVKKIPEGEKAIIISFFKGSLDLIEGVLFYDLNIGCARFDGDVSKDERAMNLERFKKCKDTKVLLMSIQCGGTGLNIVEANNVCFLDRWFNPCVHEQAEDRCWRIGQTRPVKVAYADCSMTVDEVMSAINILKSANSSVLLADGTDLGSNLSTFGYNDLSGVIGKTLQSVKAQRYVYMRLSEINKYFPLPSADLECMKDDMEVNEKKKLHLITQEEEPYTDVDTNLREISRTTTDIKLSENDDSSIEECISVEYNEKNNGKTERKKSQVMKYEESEIPLRNKKQFENPITLSENDDSSIEEPEFMNKVENDDRSVEDCILVGTKKRKKSFFFKNEESIVVANRIKLANDPIDLSIDDDDSSSIEEPVLRKNCNDVVVIDDNVVNDQLHSSEHQEVQHNTEGIPGIQNTADYVKSSLDFY